MKSLTESLQESILDIDTNIANAQASGEEWEKANKKLEEILDKLIFDKVTYEIVSVKDDQPYDVYFSTDKEYFDPRNLRALYKELFDDLKSDMKSFNKSIGMPLSDIKVLKSPSSRISNAKTGTQTTNDKYVEFHFSIWLNIKVGRYFKPAVDNFIKKHNIKKQ